jgi:hypothetical protein
MQELNSSISISSDVDTLFLFQANLFGARRSQPAVIKGDTSWVQSFIPRDEFEELFGGYVLWRKPDEPGDEMRGEAIGVWGSRNVSKLRRILRERGAQFRVLDAEGPAQRLSVIATITVPKARRK